MEYTVIREAGREFAPLEEEIGRIIAETAPVVEAITGLTLPDRVVFRTTKPKAWLEGHKRREKRLAQLEINELGPKIPTEDLRMAAARVKAGRKSRRAIWPGIGAQTIEIDSRCAEVQVLPEALKHSGRLEDVDFLCKLVGHELTHLAQFEASEGAIWTAMNSLFPGIRGIANRNHGFLIEGHAYWADREITAKVIGRQVGDEISPKASALFRKVRASRSIEEGEDLRRAVNTVSEIMETNGADAFNRVWKCLDLVPRNYETYAPELWRKRF
ncbi:hypothetical protein ACFVSQ_09190 [Streptomyces niveus]|uniref:hypothetical protein n=1 Tax=Streptomyces niveus TaxID=193462 RepID=UPI0036EE1C0A